MEVHWIFYQVDSVLFVIPDSKLYLSLGVVPEQERILDNMAEKLNRQRIEAIQRMAEHEREIYNQSSEKDKELRIDAGPYFIHDQPGEKTTDFIAEKVEKLKDPKAPASPIRNWLSVLHKNPHQADFLLERINYNGFSKKECFFAKKDAKEYTWVADALLLRSFEKNKN